MRFTQPTAIHLRTRRSIFGLFALFLFWPTQGLGQCPTEFITDPSSATTPYPKITPAEVVSAALVHANLGDNLERSWEKRVAWAPLLPRISTQVTRSTGWHEFFDLRADRPDDVDLNNNLSFRWEIRASWETDRLIFDPRSLAVSSAVRKRREERIELVAKVLKLYSEIIRLLARSKTDPPRDSEETIRRTTHLFQLTTMLDTLTGGSFCRRVTTPNHPVLFSNTPR
ncbi:MAG: hypothetical protein V1754_13205 [Pseudomonadota bacterium]